MIQTSEAFREAIVGSPRYTELFAIVDISDPDKVMLPVTSSGEAPWSKKEQIHDYDLTTPPRYATGEINRWLGDGSFDLFPDDYELPDEMGYAGNALSGPDGAFAEPFPWVQLNFTGIRVLQASSAFFSEDPVDGVPCGFTLAVYSGNQLVWSQEVEGNTETAVQFNKFTIYNPTAIRLTIKKWSLPSRYVRLVEMIVGLFERWTSSDLASFIVTLQGSFSCLTLPYGSATLSMDNVNRRFEPRRKDSFFQSIEERQAIDLYIGCYTPRGMERVKIGTFYQAGDGWKTSSNDMTMSWYLVDIIGLLTDRTFIPPETLPTTLGGWLKAVVSQLGEVFENRWHADPEYVNKPVIANNVEDVTGKKNGDIIRWACQASGTWPRADQSTGRLTAEPLWSQGNKYDLDNLTAYPTMKANDNLAVLIFQLAEMSIEIDKNGKEKVITVKREYVVSGNNPTSEKTVTVINPFIHTEEQAREMTRLVLPQYGGEILELTGRGNPSSEIGDVDTVWVNESNATTARRMSQTFQIKNGVLQNCKSTLLLADGWYLWNQFALITESGTWTAPTGVTQLRVIIGQGGQGGGYGKDGTARGLLSPQGDQDYVSEIVAGGDGKPGEDGVGGKIWYADINISSGQEFAVRIGAGGKAATAKGQKGTAGGETYFGTYSSESGKVYENGYSDIANGNSYGRTGVEVPLAGSGDGGKGGKGGKGGTARVTWVRDPNSPYGGGHETVEAITQPTSGAPGVDGASGFVLIFWDKEAEST